jgi:hypothetical protein
LKEKATIIAKTIKHFLELFDESMPITVHGLGDTWHPADGFVEEEILGNPKIVKDVFDNDYDFDGLVLFDATIGAYEVHLLSSNDDQYQFQIEARAWEIRDFANRILARNAVNPQEYCFIK